MKIPLRLLLSGSPSLSHVIRMTYCTDSEGVHNISPMDYLIRELSTLPHIEPEKEKISQYSVNNLITILLIVVAFPYHPTFNLIVF